jgi:hypothetical protein
VKRKIPDPAENRSPVVQAAVNHFNGWDSYSYEFKRMVWFIFLKLYVNISEHDKEGVSLYFSQLCAEEYLILLLVLANHMAYIKETSCHTWFNVSLLYKCSQADAGVLPHIFQWTIRVRGSIPSESWEFSSSPPRPDWLRCPPSLLSSGYRGL